MKVILALAIPVLGLTITIAAPVSTAAEYMLVQNLAPQEVNLRAKQFTVRIDGAGIGTGVIIDQSETTYKVLTNWHVVKQRGEYFVQTIDGRKYPVNYSTVKRLPNLDLAILQFEGKQNYQLAEVGNSNNLVEGQDIYFAGYPGELRKEDNRYYRFFATNLVGILPESTANGYSLIYNGEAFPGMSGGPVLDSQGLLIGIHGETNIHAITGGTSNYAIPIDRYQVAISNDSPSPNQNTNQQNNNPVETSATPSIQQDTISSENPTPTETPPSNESVTVESSPNTESVSNSQANQDSTPNESSPEGSQSPSDTENNSSLSAIISVPTLTTPVKNPSQPSESQTKPSESQVKPELLSRTTGIDYTPLKKLLAKQEWQEADRQTQQLVMRIVETAKRQNNRSFITINAIADYACQDIRTIDALWQQSTNNKFGFTPQQAIWQNIQQNSGFSLDAWRSFVTEIGWKQGEISNSGGYLLYEQLTFDPETAPQGHLPWWFAASEEQQNIIKTVFNRCSLQEIDEPEEVTPEDLEADINTTEGSQRRLERRQSMKPKLRQIRQAPNKPKPR